MVQQIKDAILRLRGCRIAGIDADPGAAAARHRTSQGAARFQIDPLDGKPCSDNKKIITSGLVGDLVSRAILICNPDAERPLLQIVAAPRRLPSGEISRQTYLPGGTPIDATVHRRAGASPVRRDDYDPSL